MEEDILDNSYVGTADVYLNDELIHQENVFISFQKDKVKKSFWEKIFGWLND